MKIPIEVEVVMESCKDCPRLELETISMMKYEMHRCKNVNLCRIIIDLWENTKRGEEK